MQFHNFPTIKQRAIQEVDEDGGLIREVACGIGIDSNYSYGAVKQYTRGVLKKQTAAAMLAEACGEENDITRARLAAAPIGRRAGSDRSKMSAFCEFNWLQHERPYYNVYPIVEELVNKTKLNFSAAFLRFPFQPLVFRFAAGHEPLGITSALITIGSPRYVPEGANMLNSVNRRLFGGICATAIVNYVKPLANGALYEVYPLGMFAAPDDGLITSARPWEPTIEEITADPQNLIDVGSGTFLSKKSAGPKPDPLLEAVTNKYKLLSIEHSIGLQHNYSENELSFENRAALCVSEQSLEVYQFLFKLAVFASMLHAGDDLITPIVLAKHQERYDKETDEAARKWLEDKAAKIQGRGFNFGKGLQERCEMSPHLRNSHMALFWTGIGRVKPLLKLRRGSVITPKHLSRVPTGFMGPEQPDEGMPVMPREYVYFLRDPYSGFVKIGQTRRTIAGRKKQLEVYHGLTLIGDIVTGDCVALETRLHREYAAKRRRRPDGRRSEFFELTDTEVQEIVTRHGGTFHLESEIV